MAKKKEELKTNVVRLLEAAGIPHRAYLLPLDKDQVPDGITAAALMGQPVEKVFKTLVAEGPKGEHFVFVIRVAETLDLKKAAREASQKSLAMIHVKEINQVTGYIRGGCTAIGMKKAYPVFIEETARSQERIIVSGGKLGTQIELAPDDLQKACQGIFCSFCI